MRVGYSQEQGSDRISGMNLIHNMQETQTCKKWIKKSAAKINKSQVKD